MNTDEMLAAITTRDYTFHVGRYEKVVPAGSLVLFRQEAVESGRRCGYARLASNPRVSTVIPFAGTVPA